MIEDKLELFNPKNALNFCGKLSLVVLTASNLAAYGPTCGQLNSGLSKEDIMDIRYERCPNNTLCDYTLDLFFGVGQELAFNFNVIEYSNPITHNK